MSEIGTSVSERRGRSWGRIALYTGIVLALLIAGGALALVGERVMLAKAQNEVRIQTFEDWRVICPPLAQRDAPCALTQDVNRDLGGTIVALSLDSADPGATMSVTVPHGILLEPGLGFSVGNDPMRVRPYETCGPVGCFAVVTLDADTLKALQSNETGQVVVVPGAGAPVTVPFSLKGFTEGHAALARAASRRNSFWAFLDR